MIARATIRDIAAIVALRSLAEVVINPAGNFPLNDDWAWGRTVQTLVDTGRFSPPGWGPMSLIAHVLWGGLFCLPAGFSFTALRLAAFVAALVAGSGCYLLTLEASGSRVLSVVAALTWLFNPVTFALSATFMTEVPFVALVVLAALFFARHLRSGADRHLVLGTLFSVAAILSRQLAFIVPAAFALALVAKRGFSVRVVGRAMLVVFACYGVLFVYEQWLVASGRLAERYRPLTIGFLYALQTSARGPRGHVETTVGLALLYLGCLALPMSILLAPLVLRSPKTIAARAVVPIGALVVILAVMYGMTMAGAFMPLAGNVLAPQGIGPATLRDIYILGLPNFEPLPRPFWAFVTFMSVLGALLLVAALAVSVARILQALMQRRWESSHAVTLFLFCCAAGVLVPLLAEGFLDRYLVPSLPFVTAAACACIPRNSSRRIPTCALAPAVVVLAAVAGFSVAGTRDYLSWNRARWRLLDEMMTSHVATPREIDGGFEFNGWHLYTPSYVADAAKSWWWVERDEYVVAFGELPGWRVVRESRFKRWLPPGDGKVVVLARTND